MCSTTTIPTHLKFKPPNPTNHIPVAVAVCSLKNFTHYSKPHNYYFRFLPLRNPMLCWACSDDGQADIFSAKKQSSAHDIEALSNSSSSSNDGYIALFIRMLGLDNDPLDREQAVVALWKYSLGGKHCVDKIMKYHGTINLVVNLLKSDSDSACEASAGLLRVISSINLYRDLVAESGAIEQMTVLLTCSSLSSNVKEQTLCTLWNLSIDEKLSDRMTSSEILPLLVKYLEDEDIKVKEAAGGILANLTLTQSNHKIMVEAGVIPKLVRLTICPMQAKLLTADEEESKVIRKEARNALLELAKDEYNRILVMEEGLVLVPLVGAAAYKSFKPALYSWPSLPDGTRIEQSSKSPSRYGASELLLGLSIDNKNANLEEAKMKAIIGRTHQEFLARVGAIENEDDGKSNGEPSSSRRFTLLPWMHAVARLVLILGLEDELAIAKAAESIADASINEHMRVSFKEAGAIKHLVQLINHPSDNVRWAVIQALDRLSISNNVCWSIEAEGVLHPLINLLKQSKSDISHSLTLMILNILTRILDPSKELKSKLYDGPINGSSKGWRSTKTPASANAHDMISSELTSRTLSIDVGELVDLSFLSFLVDLLKTPNSDLQRKASSILEFVVGIEPCMEKLRSADIVSGLEAVFRQNCLIEEENGREVHKLELEEAGLAVSAASQLLTRLLDYEELVGDSHHHHLTKLLRSILVSSIPLQNKEWVAACLVKLSSSNMEFEDAVNVEVRIPRLIEEMKNSYSPQKVKEGAVLELKRIISQGEGTVDCSRAVASGGGIFAVVELMEKGSQGAVEASLAILYNLSMDEENHAAIIAAGAVPVLRKLVLSERSQWMQQRALRLLRTLPTSYHH